MEPAILPSAVLLERHRAGDPQAAQQLVGRYWQRLVGQIAPRINPILSARFDAEDVALSVFRTIFRRAGAGTLTVSEHGKLWGLLVRIAVCKTARYARQELHGKRDPRAEAADKERLLLETLATEPSPADAASVREVLDGVLLGLTQTHHQMADMLMQGYTVAEIMADLNVSQRSVYRVRALLHERLERALALHDGEPNSLAKT